MWVVVDGTGMPPCEVRVFKQVQPNIELCKGTFLVSVFYCTHVKLKPTRYFVAPQVVDGVLS